MKSVLRRTLNGILSTITTLLIMASPVAAMVYAAEPAAANGYQSFGVAQATPAKLYTNNANGLKLQLREWKMEVVEQQAEVNKSVSPKQTLKVVE